MITDEILEKVKAFHEEVDRLAGRLFRIHRGRLKCRQGCAFCCIDDLAVFEVEAERIRREAAGLLATARPHPVGLCAFLSDDGACRIYSVRPYVCRTQGLPLRWTGECEDGSLAEQRDICELNEPGPPVDEIPRRDCWTLGPFEDRLAALQARADGGRGRRVRLRDLWPGSSVAELGCRDDRG